MTHSDGASRRAGRVLPPLPVDRGWAWLIMLAAYVNLMVATIFARALSIILPYILNRYQASATVTTLAVGISDLAWSVANIAIPTLLLPRFSVRSLALVGSLVHSLCIVAIAYSPNIIIFNCVFGVMGFAAGLMIVPPLIHIGHFFKKRLAFANGFTYAGVSTATVFVPRLTQYLESVYGSQGALLIVAGICFNCVAASMLLRPLSMYSRDENVSKLNEETSVDHEFSDFGNLQIKTKTLTHDEYDDDARETSENSKFLDDDDSRKEKINETILQFDLKITGSTHAENGNVHHELAEDVEEKENISNKNTDNDLDEIFALLPNTTSDTTDIHLQTSIGIPNKRNSVSSNKYNSISNPDVSLKQASVSNDHLDSATINYIQISNNLLSSVLKLAPDVDHELSVKHERKSSHAERDFDQTGPIVDHKSNLPDNDASVFPGGGWSIRKMIGYLRSSVLLNPVAVMLILAGGLSTPGGNMYIPVLGLENGLAPEEVPWMQTIMGVADIVGKLGFGYFADLGYLRPIRLACLAQITTGLMCQFTMFYKGFGAMAAMAIVYGMTSGICQSLTTPMIIEMVGLQYLGQVTPVYFLVGGIATFIANVSFGAVRDATGSFMGGFNFLGGMFLLSLAVLLLEPVFVCSRDRIRRGSKSDKSGKQSLSTSNSSA